MWFDKWVICVLPAVTWPYFKTNGIALSWLSRQMSMYQNASLEEACAHKNNK